MKHLLSVWACIVRRTKSTLTDVQMEIKVLSLYIIVNYLLQSWGHNCYILVSLYVSVCSEYGFLILNSKSRNYNGTPLIT